MDEHPLLALHHLSTNRSPIPGWTIPAKQKKYQSTPVLQSTPSPIHSNPTNINHTSTSHYCYVFWINCHKTFSTHNNTLLVLYWFCKHGFYTTCRCSICRCFHCKLVKTFKTQNRGFHPQPPCWCVQTALYWTSHEAKLFCLSSTLRHFSYSQSFKIFDVTLLIEVEVVMAFVD